MSNHIDQWLDRTVNVVVLGAIAFAVFRPGGVIGSRVAEWREATERQRIVEEALAERGQAPESDPPLIIEFLDYQCPFCREAEDSVAAARLRQDFVVEYRHLPLTAIHPRAEEAALVAICAEHQGVFEPVHRRLLATGDWTSSDLTVWPPIAEVIPDNEEFRRCLSGEKARARLEGDRALANRLGLSGTPSFVSALGHKAGLPSVAELLELVSEDRAP